MRVSWKATHSGCPSRVHYARSPEAVARLAAALSSDPAAPLPPLPDAVDEGWLSDVIELSYAPKDMCANPARNMKIEEQFFQSSVMTGLVPGTRYYYRLHGSREVLAFDAAPVPGPDVRSSFVVFGDMGESEHAYVKAPGAKATARHMAEEADAGINMVLHVGDIAYADGRPEVWDTFMRYIEPTATRVPYMVTAGNHEYGYESHHHADLDPSGAPRPYLPDWGNFGNDSGGECGVPFVHRFVMPASDALRAPANATTAPGPAPASADDSHGAPGPARHGADAADAAAGIGRHHAHGAPNAPWWYSWSYGSVTYVAVSAEHDITPSSRQYAWLQATLKAVDRCTTPWLVLLMHRPMYVVFPHKSNRIVAEHLRDSLERLLSEHEVDLVFSGHVHSYARTCNVLDERCTAEAAGGTVHVTLGCAGHKLSDIGDDQPSWLEAARYEHGYGRVTVDGARSLLFEFVRNEDGAVRDHVRITNERHERRRCGALAQA